MRNPKRGRPPKPDLAESRREQILAVATEHFARLGYHATDVQKLADSLNLGKGTVYRYFKCKGDLFLAAADRVMRLLRIRVDAVRAQEADPLDQIYRAVGEYLAFFDANPEFVELLIQERAVFRDRKTPTYFEHRERNSGRWQALYRELIEAGRVRPMPPETISDVLSSALYGAMFTNFFAGRRKSLEKQAADIVDIVFTGILSDAERSRWRATAASASGG